MVFGLAFVYLCYIVRMWFVRSAGEVAYGLGREGRVLFEIRAEEENVTY